MNKLKLVLATITLVVSSTAWAANTNNNGNDGANNGNNPPVKVPKVKVPKVVTNPLTGTTTASPVTNTTVTPTQTTTVTPTQNTHVGISNANHIGVGVGVDTNVKSSADSRSQSGALAGSLSGSASNSGAKSSSGDSLSGAASNSGDSVSGSDASSGGNTLATGSQYSTSSSNTQFLNLPTHVVPVAPSVIAGAQVVQSVGSCGILQKIDREQVTGTFHGLFVDSSVKLGFRETLRPYVDANGVQQLFKQFTVNGLTYLIGHQPVILSTVVATGGARQIGLGGNSSTGSNGSGSLGSSGSNQQMVEHIQLTECIYQVSK